MKPLESSYTLGPGACPNPIFDAAKSYLEAAESSFAIKEAKTGFLQFKNWYVAPHLSVIATEIFLKSFKVILFYGPVTGPDDPRYFKCEQACKGLKPALDDLPKAIDDDLRSHLPDRLFKLMVTLSNDEICRGRYPFELPKDRDAQRFPVDEEAGKQLANDWLSLAQALSKFGFQG